MYFPGTCPDCQNVGLEGVLAEPQDYLKCESCGWRSDEWMAKEYGEFVAVAS